MLSFVHPQTSVHSSSSYSSTKPLHTLEMGTSAAEPELLPQSHHSFLTAVQYCRGGSHYRGNSKRTSISAPPSRYFLPSGTKRLRGIPYLKWALQNQPHETHLFHAGWVLAGGGGVPIGSHAAAGGKIRLRDPEGTSSTNHPSDGAERHQVLAKSLFTK